VIYRLFQTTTVCVLALFSLPACYGDSEDDRTPGPTAGAALGADPCETASPVDQAQSIALSWSVPGCLRLGPQAGVEETTAETYDANVRVSVIPLATSPEQRFPAGLLPFDSGGCDVDTREIRLTGRDPSGSRRFFAVASCLPAPGDCLGIVDPSGTPITIADNGATCIRWAADGAAASYRVEIRYPLVAEAYAYLAPASASSYLLPDIAAPLLGESAARCMARKELVVEVFAQEPGKPDRRVAYTGASLECSIVGD